MIFPSRLKRMFYLLTPPIVVQVARRLRLTLPEWEYMPQGWAAPGISAYDDRAVLEVMRETYPPFAAQVREKDWLSGPTLMLTQHNLFMTFAYVLARAAVGRESVSMLDYGGSLGQYLEAARALLPEIKIDYSCREMPALAEHGQTLHPDAHFYRDDSCFARTYDLVFASCSLHYVQDWQPVLTALGQAAEQFLFVTRLPCTDAPSYVFVQRPYQYGYKTQYLAWCLNKHEFVAAAERSGLAEEREFWTGEDPPVVNAPGPCRYLGFLFRPAGKSQ